MIAKRILVGVTLGIILALLVVPQTRPLVRMQVQDTLHLGAMPWGGDKTRIRQFAAAHPDDFLLQYAAKNALEMDYYPDDTAQHLRGLEKRFPDNPALRANILRLACEDELHLSPPETIYLMQAAPTPGMLELPIINPEAVAAFDRDAVAGERLDPGNAYFPFMRAIALYAMHRNAEMRSSILQASKCPRWDDYSTVQVAAESQMDRMAFGDTSVVTKVFNAESILYANMACLRQVAWIATYEAMQDEIHGDIPTGTQLRLALIHTGDLMRAESPSLIGSLVGCAITQIAMQRPGGLPWVTPPSAGVYTAQFVDEYSPSVAEPYEHFLRSHGEAGDATWVTAVAKADQQTVSTAERVNPFDTFSSEASPFGRMMRKLLLYWIVDLAFLVNLFCMIAVGILAAYWHRRSQNGLPKFHWKIGVGCLVISIAVVFLIPELTLSYRQMIDVLGSSVWSPLYPNYYPVFHATAMEILVNITAPILVLIASLVLIRRFPIHQTVAVAAIPVGCVLILAYAGVVAGTARQAHRVNLALTQTLHGEGRYLAEQAGQTWPEAVPLPPGSSSEQARKTDLPERSGF
jgi:hypothetical protein